MFHMFDDDDDDDDGGDDDDDDGDDMPAWINDESRKPLQPTSKNIHIWFLSDKLTTLYQPQNNDSSWKGILVNYPSWNYDSLWK